MMHAMATHHGDTGGPLNRGLDILTEDSEHTDINKGSTHSLDAKVALEGREAVGHPEDPVYNDQNRLAVLTREINDLHQRVAAEGQPAETLDHIQQELQNLTIAIHQPQPPAPTEPFGEAIMPIHGHFESTQKQFNLTNSLMQDIPVFNVHDSAKLEGWLIEIETAADLTNESRVRHVKVESQGLMHTLVTGAISSNKSWDEIRDLLRLKCCNADIHMYMSHFMEIQQQEKESLAAYVHQFKTKAKRCNFVNGAATIRIFMKGLKNGHSLATCIYEKGPQTMNDAISEGWKA